jgi:hypothetical protein
VKRRQSQAGGSSPDRQRRKKRLYCLYADDKESERSPNGGYDS